MSGGSYKTIGEQLGPRWAAVPVAAAERREQAQSRGANLDSRAILAL
jgi:hypothetical protein